MKLVNGIELNQELVDRIQYVVGKGLSCGLGDRALGKMCVEAAICYSLGLPHNDNPECVYDDLRHIKININDEPWSNKQVRAKGMVRAAIAQLGTAATMTRSQLVEMEEYIEEEYEARLKKYISRNWMNNVAIYTISQSLYVRNDIKRPSKVYDIVLSTLSEIFVEACIMIETPGSKFLEGVPISKLAILKGNTA